MNGFGGNGFGKKTANAGTAINRLVPPKPQNFTRVSKIVATAGVTAHTVTALRPLGRTKTSAVAAAGQAVVNLVADPGPSGNGIAANDLVAIREVDGVTRLYTVSSVSTLAITLTGNLTAGAAKGADFWDFGIATDSDPRTGEAHQAFAVAASATTTYTDTEGGVVASIGVDEPILLQNNNATNAGSIDQVSFAYTRE